jgi:predicted RNA-binding protein with PUA-like domain
MKQYWLMKSEPTCFSIDDLCKRPRQTAPWDGIRNYQARNFIRDAMRVGDQMFFYHSSCNPPGIVGIAEIVSEPYPDYTAFDPTSDHPDMNSTPEKPRWFMVDVQFKEKFPHIIPIEQLRRHPELENMPLLRKGNRLSITPVSQQEWDAVLQIKIVAD